ncbi:hypothetical protein GTQ43_29660 [Nostoc sp. KVJ3]|uniref:hypothetical protein n=1 Tax=Nostoc sp. KVJ3 TaxID=457945 RepID=UPI002237FD17|nr:hypothetical protein [Nostoc sp. KVJ3]MCW5317794.1 hypothetical protein [Nostoc sp. KVJ3]
MNTKIIAFLGITAAFVSLGSQVYAQSPASKANPGQYRFTGDSLIGIDRRTAQNDFGRFFEQTNPASISNNRRDKTPAKIQFNESLSLPDTSVFLTPARSGNDNDGLQVQLDIKRQ